MQPVCFTGKQVLFGITGSIAAFKAVGWIRELKRLGADVHVIMTRDAQRFITPLTCAALSGNRVWGDMFDPLDAETIPHITLGRRADLVVIAPATAQTMARLAHGQADDLLAAVVLATRAPVFLFPAMNAAMYTHPATRRNLEQLKAFGYRVIEPASGEMACDDQGPGRLVEWGEAFASLASAVIDQDMAGETVVVTSGPTREFFDPVRCLTNPSTGRMGHALAITAQRRGARVLLIAGPSELPPPVAVEYLPVTSAADMLRQVESVIDQATIAVMAAAVSDYCPTVVAPHKIKKGAIAETLSLERTEDILLHLGEREYRGKKPLLIGFAAESRDHCQEGARKLILKKCDMVVVNDITKADCGFGADTNQVTILDAAGGNEPLPCMSKLAVADKIWDKAVTLLSAHRG